MSPLTALGRAPLALAAALLLAAAPAHAQLSVGVGTDFPVDLAARVDYQAPEGLRLSASLGYLPELYIQTTSDLLVALDVWSQDTADLVTETLSSSMVIRLHAGWRPSPSSGFYFTLGYGLLALGGGATRGALIAGVTGFSPPLSARSGDYDISAVVHQLDLELGWEWPLGEHLRLRAAIGGAFTMAASVTVTPPELNIPFLESTFADDSAAYIHDLITGYVHSPTVTLGAAYTF